MAPELNGQTDGISIFQYSKFHTLISGRLCWDEFQIQNSSLLVLIQVQGTTLSEKTIFRELKSPKTRNTTFFDE